MSTNKVGAGSIGEIFSRFIQTQIQNAVGRQPLPGLSSRDIQNPGSLAY